MTSERGICAATQSVAADEVQTFLVRMEAEAREMPGGSGGGRWGLEKVGFSRPRRQGGSAPAAAASAPPARAPRLSRLNSDSRCVPRLTRPRCHRCHPAGDRASRHHREEREEERVLPSGRLRRRRRRSGSVVDAASVPSYRDDRKDALLGLQLENAQEGAQNRLERLLLTTHFVRPPARGCASPREGPPSAVSFLSSRRVRSRPGDARAVRVTETLGAHPCVVL